MKLIPVDPQNETHVEALYLLLGEREPWQSISHLRMPTIDQHRNFVFSEPYAAWYLVTEMNSRIVGCVYLSRANEIGVSIFKAEQHAGWGQYAVRELMRLHPGRKFLANINPANEPSRKMFEKLGFKLVQHTYALEAE